jgi:hypothetical protein
VCTYVYVQFNSTISLRAGSLETGRATPGEFLRASGTGSHVLPGPRSEASVRPGPPRRPRRGAHAASRCRCFLAGGSQEPSAGP